MYQNPDFLVQVYEENKEEGIIRLSINRATGYNPRTKRWADGISWDDLQDIKSALGFGHLDGVEFYPRDTDMVNVANMRHLFLFPDPLRHVWRNKPKETKA